MWKASGAILLGVLLLACTGAGGLDNGGLPGQSCEQTKQCVSTPIPHQPLVPEAPGPKRLSSRAAGTMALSPDDRTAVVAEEDTGALLVVDLPAMTVRASVPVGRDPRAVAWASDDSVWVACRGSRKVVVVDPVAAAVVAEVPVAPEPWGLAETPDGRQMLVVTRTGARLEVIDLATRKAVSSWPIPPDGTRIAAPKAGRAFVFHDRSGRVSVIDLATGRFDHSIELTEPPVGAQEARVAEQPASPVLLPGTNTLFVPHQLAKVSGTATNEPDAYLGRALHVPVVAYAMARIDVASEALLSAAGTCFGCGNVAESGGAAAVGQMPPAVIRARFRPMAGPVATVTDGLGHFVFTANRSSANMLAVPAFDDPHNIVPVAVGGGPSGLAITSTDDRLYVYASFDHRLSRIMHRAVDAVNDGPVSQDAGPGAVLVIEDQRQLLPDPLDLRLARGRRLFYAADNPQMTDPADGGIACASCHPEGREDGRTWQFSEGPRNTPLLAGRRLQASPPFHWDGLLENEASFMTIVQQRMGGKPQLIDNTRPKPLGGDALIDIIRWIDTLDPPDNPLAATAVDAEERGRLVFEGKARCSECHPAPLFTDNGYHDVGSLVAANPALGGAPDRFPNGINTPTLLGIFASAPYLHDGSAPTLRDRLAQNPGDRHGTTSTLTPAELGDLVTYLERL